MQESAEEIYDYHGGHLTGVSRKNPEYEGKPHIPDFILPFTAAASHPRSF